MRHQMVLVDLERYLLDYQEEKVVVGWFAREQLGFRLGRIKIDGKV